MKTFFKDCKEYQSEISKLTKVWYKKHWKGTVIFNIVLLTTFIGVMCLGKIKTTVQVLTSTNKDKNQEDELA